MPLALNCGIPVLQSHSQRMTSTLKSSARPNSFAGAWIGFLRRSEVGAATGAKTNAQVDGPFGIRSSAANFIAKHKRDTSRTNIRVTI